MIDFPDAPATQVPVNTFSPLSTPLATTNGVTYVWDGVKWNSQATQITNGLIRHASQPATGTSVVFGDIPDWAKRITVALESVGTNGSSVPAIQLGTASGWETIGYDAYVGNRTNSATSANRIPLILTHSNTMVLKGTCTLVRGANNVWTSISTIGGTIPSGGGSHKNMPDVLTRLRVTTTNGSDQYTSGNITVLYEG